LQVLATARRPLIKPVESGTYLRELATTLSTLVVELPPLAERIDDVPLLVQHFIEQFNAKGDRQLSGASPEALDQLAAYGWPGNVDELEEVVREACRAADGPFVAAADLPKRLRQATSAAAHPRAEEETIVLDELLAQIEADLVRRAMRRAKGNKTKAAQLLGVTRPRLHRKLVELEEQESGS
jgi:DNA-binding NtrC family response regulator